MRCYQIKPILQCYLDGELSLGEPEMVAEHLSRCVSCRNELYELKRASILLRRVASRPVSPGFSRGVIRGAQEIQQTGILQEKRAGQTISELPPFRMSHAALLAASLTLVALGGWWLGRSPDVLPPKPREYAEHPGVIRELAKQQVKRQMADRTWRRFCVSDCSTWRLALVMSTHLGERSRSCPSGSPGTCPASVRCAMPGCAESAMRSIPRPTRARPPVPKQSSNRGCG